MSQLEVTGLPTRQAEALLLTARGMTRKEAARKMSCSPANVVMLMDTVRFKLQAKTAAEAVSEAFKRGHLKYIPILLVCLCSALSASDHQYRPIRRSPRVVRVMRTINQRNLSALI